ncbi:Tn3 family transposase [Streptosporangium sp. NPDC001681]|uniref:Tn3 family transposase n=1 Tax=Streptosporangium sp. NPDC001681 TaxID=3154395 RepID=UPI0033271EE1
MAAEGLPIQVCCRIQASRSRASMPGETGPLGLALNAVVLFNSLHIDAAVKQPAANGFPITDELLARLSPLQFDHVNLLGRYAFTRSPVPGLRPPHDPNAADESAENV